jgi:hypothetical protein
MSNVQNLSKSIASLTKSIKFDAYSKILINITDELYYEAGDDSGRTLTLFCPWGTQEMADNLLAQINGFSYQPFTADGALLDPAAELGDGVNVDGIQSGIYRLDTKFNSNCPANISAPSDEEVDYLFPYESKESREIKRQNKKFSSLFSIHADQIAAEVTARENDVDTLKGQLSVQSDQISAKVSKQGSSTSFGWDLTDNSWELKSNGKSVLYADKDGLKVSGEITAKSGKVGAFTIGSDYLSYNGKTWDGPQAVGAYIGKEGIQLGANFKVDNLGNLYAHSGTFLGTVRAGSIQYGSGAGTLSGAAITTSTLTGSALTAGTITGSKVGSSTLTSTNMNAGITTSLGRADVAYNVCTGVTSASSIITQTLRATSSASVESLYINGSSVTKQSTTFKDANGNNVTISYWG